MTRRELASRSATPRGLAYLLVAIVAMTITLGLTASRARAGDWMQISCVNPNGSASTSEGWSEATSATGAAATSTACGPGQPMQALLSILEPAPSGSFAQLQYTPPAGSTLTGGSVDAILNADGFGDASGKPDVVTEAKLASPTAADPFEQCVLYFSSCGPPSDALNFSGTVTLPVGRGGQLYVTAQCAPGSADACDKNAHDNAWATADIASARLLLSSAESPTGSAFSGSALQPGVRGTGHVVFTASEPSGPGIYAVSAALDGRTVYAGTPNPNGGDCQPVGTDAATGALEFDHLQPCLLSEVVDVPVPTSGLSDGRHELSITVQDAADNSATVFDQTITTSNPQLTPRARGTRAIRAQFLVHWRFRGASTRLQSVRVLHLPRGAAVSARCTGPGCPRVAARDVAARRIGRLLRRLTGRRFRAGDQLHLDITQPRHRPLHLVLAFRDGARPVARLARR
jgi:hypothetical protein